MVKPPKLTPEEKKQLKEIKKLETKKAAVETKRQIQRDVLARELKFGKINRAKLKNIWKQTLYDIKIPVLRREFKLAVNNADKVLDNKDFIISLLMDELDISEEQHIFNFRTHCEKIDKFYNIFLLRLKKIKQEYDSELGNIQNLLQQKKDEINRKHEEAEEYMKTMIFALSTQNKFIDSNNRAVYISKMNESVRKYTDDLAIYRKRGEDICIIKWNSYITRLENFMQQQIERFNENDKLFERDNFLTDIIKKQSQNIMNQYSSKRNLIDQFANEKENINAKIGVLKNEQQFLNDIMKNLKKCIKIDENYDKKQLSFLVLESNSAIKILKEIVKFAEKILRYYSLVRKYETFKEKLLPFPQLEPVKTDTVIKKF